MTPSLFDKDSPYESANYQPPPETPASPLIITRASAVEESPVGWIWPGRIPLAMLTLLEGDPGAGKSTLLVDLVARVTTGRPMPDGTGGGEPRSVVLLSAEDDWGKVIRPRLRAAGADLERVVFVSIRTETGTREPSISDEDVAQIEEAVWNEGAVLLVVDPIVSYLPEGVDTNSDHSVRRALNRLKTIAERNNCAVIAVRHWRKGASDNPLYRGGGSIGFTAAARAQLQVGYDPEDETKQVRVLAVSKVTLVPIAPSMGFKLTVKAGDAFPQVEWLGVSRHSAVALTAAPGGQQHKVGEAVDFLKEALEDGPQQAKALIKQAREEDHSSASLRRAREHLGITRKRGTVYRVLEADGSTPWYWRLGAQDAHIEKNEHLPMNGADSVEHLPMTEAHGDAWEGDEQ